MTHSQDTEAALLGGLLFAPSAVADVSDLLVADDFHHPAHRIIYAAITALDAEGGKIDVITVGNHLRAAGTLDDIGGLPYLGELVRNTASAANVKAYAERIRDLSLERQVLERTYSAQQIMQDVGTTAEKVDAVQRLFLDIGARTDEGPRSARDLMPSALDRLEKLSQSDSAITGLPTGLTDFDNMTSGLQPADLVIVAARPSMGKTAFAMNIAEHVALKQRLPVLVFSMEMPAEQLLMRMAASVGRVPFEHVRVPSRMREEDWPRLTKATTEIAHAAIHIDETPAMTPAQIRARARRFKQRHGCGLIVVDYLQLMQVPGYKPGQRTAEITEASRSLKALAKELNVPVIALSQLNRSLESRQDKRPIMSDLRESGAIEQD